MRFLLQSILNNVESRMSRYLRRNAEWRFLCVEAKDQQRRGLGELIEVKVSIKSCLLSSSFFILLDETFAPLM